MPVKLERELKRKVADKDWSDEKKDAYVYGTLRKTGWKPKREKKKELHAKLDDLIELKEKETRYNPGAGTIGGLVAPIAVAGAVGVGTKEAIGSGGDKAIRSADLPLMQKLNIEANKSGADVFKSTNPDVPAVAYVKQKGFMGKVSKAQMQMVTGEDKLPDKAVAISPAVRKPLKPGILAHEIGHIKQPAWMTKPWTRIAGQYGPVGTAIYGASTSDEKRAQIAAGAGTASAAPMLISEVDASLRGKRLLEKHGLKGGRRFSPGIGLASYGAVAALPALAYGTKKALGGYKPKEKQLSAKLDNIIEFQSRRDPEERLRDRLEILSKITGTAAGVGLLGAAGYGVHTIHKHGKGLLKETRSAAQAMGRAGQAVENLDKKTDTIHRVAEAVSEAIEKGNESGESADVVRGFKRARSSAGWLGRLFGSKGIRALDAKLDDLIEFARGDYAIPALNSLRKAKGASFLERKAIGVFANPFYKSKPSNEPGSWLWKSIRNSAAMGIKKSRRLSAKLEDLIEFGIVSPSQVQQVFGRGSSFSNLRKVAGGIEHVSPGVAAPKVMSATMATGGVRGPTPFGNFASARAGVKPGVTPPPTGFYKPMATGVPETPTSSFADMFKRRAAARPPTAAAAGGASPPTPPLGGEPPVGGGAQSAVSKFPHPLLIGAAGGLAAGGVGGYLLAPRRQQTQYADSSLLIKFELGKYSLEEKLDDIIHMGNDPRPRDNLGQFAPPGEGGPDRNAMAITYAPPQPEKKSGLGAGALATAGIAGAAGEGGAIAFRKVLEKVKASKLKK